MAADRLLVPVANPETAERLVDTAIDLARDRGLEIVVLTVVTVPMQLTLEQARAHLDIDEQERLVGDAVDLARRAGVDATGRVRLGRSVADGILTVADDLDVASVLLGWRGRPRRRDVVLGSYIDAVLAEAPCDVLVERIDRDRAAVESVLVPVAGGPNTELAASVGGSIARRRDASVELLTVVSSREGNTVEDARETLIRASRALGAVGSVSETVLEGDVVERIVDRSARHDVTVIGAAESGLLRRVLVGDVPEAVGREADGTVIMAKRRQDISDAIWRRIRDRIRFS